MVGVTSEGGTEVFFFFLLLFFPPAGTGGPLLELEGRREVSGKGMMDVVRGLAVEFKISLTVAASLLLQIA